MKPEDDVVVGVGLVKVIHVVSTKLCIVFSFLQNGVGRMRLFGKERIVLCLDVVSELAA